MLEALCGVYRVVYAGAGISIRQAGEQRLQK